MSMRTKSKTKDIQRHPLRTSKTEARKHILSPDTKFVITEAYNSARTNMIFALSTCESKVLVFSSASPAEGKSTTAINMSISFAATGAKVLLIDGDLRKPVIHSLFRLKKGNGLSSILGGMCTVAEAIHSNIRENLDVIASGPIPPNPAELLGSPNMKELVDVLSNHYDYILVDTPPVNVVSDSQLLNPVAAGLILVIRDNYTKHGDVQQALNNINLANGKVLGFVKTACRAKKQGGYYKKPYYKYGNYRYDYSYSYKASAEDTDD